EHAACAQAKEKADSHGQCSLHCALAHDQHKNVAAMRAERHPNADLTCATGDGVCLHAIHTNDGEEQRDSAKDSEEQRAETHDPEANAFFSKIDKRRNAQDWQIGIDAAQCLTHGGNERGDGMSICCSKTHMQVNIPVISLRERHKQSPI